MSILLRSTKQCHFPYFQGPCYGMLPITARKTFVFLRQPETSKLVDNAECLSVGGYLLNLDASTTVILALRKHFQNQVGISNNPPGRWTWTTRRRKAGRETLSRLNPAPNDRDWTHLPVPTHHHHPTAAEEIKSMHRANEGLAEVAVVERKARQLRSCETRAESSSQSHLGIPNANVRCSLGFVGLAIAECKCKSCLRWIP